jgi:hypothetical protein
MSTFQVITAVRQGFKPLPDCGMNLKFTERFVPSNKEPFDRNLIPPPEAEKGGAVPITQR